MAVKRLRSSLSCDPALMGKVRFKAACAILDLGYGKPQQYVEPQEREPLRTIAPATLEEWASILRQAGLLLPST